MCIHVNYALERSVHILGAGYTYQNTHISFEYGRKMLTLLAKSLLSSAIRKEIFVLKIIYLYTQLFFLDLLVRCILVRSAEVQPFRHVL